MALYISAVATDSFDFKFYSRNNYVVSEFTTFIPPVVVYVVDYYDEVVESDYDSLPC